MIKLVVLTLLFASPGEQQTRALEAFDREDYGTAAQILGDLALGDEPHTFDRGGLIIAAGNSWRLEFLHTGKHEAVCTGIELMRSYFSQYQDTAPDVAARYWALVGERNTNDITCTPEPLATVVTEPSPVVVPPRPLATVVTEPSPVVVPPRPPIRLPVTSPSPPSADNPRDTRPLKIAGGVLTASAGVGVAILAGQAVVFAQRLETYRLAHGHDEALKQRAKSMERWMIGTGVTACVALASGITLLAIAHRRTTVQPSLGGLTIQGKF